MTTRPTSPEGARIYADGLFVLPRHNWSWFLLRGIVAIALGVLALFMPGFTVFAFAMLFAAFSFADGVFSLIAGIRGARDHRDRWGSLVFSGITGIAVGVLFFIWPMLATAAYAFLLVLFVAVWSFITGVFELGAAIRLRKQIAGEWLLGLSGVLSVLLAIVLVAMIVAAPGATLISIGWLIGIYALASGVALVLLALRLRPRR